MSYVLISPCRNEADYMRETLDSVIAQSLKPDKWVIVDDGSTDATPEILNEYQSKYDWIDIVKKENRGNRSVGPGVVETFYEGLNTIDINKYNYLCKLDLDLRLPTQYFETLVKRIRENPRIGTCSGKAYMALKNGKIVSEKCGDEMSVGMTKFYRTTCFNDIGGFVKQVMWDAIDCHRCRMLGWIACSWDIPELRFIHLRPMGSSQKGIFTGRMRHGYGQYFMGTGLTYMTATALFRMVHPPYIVGGLATLVGYLKSLFKRDVQYQDKALRDFVSRYQWQALLHGKKKAIDAINEKQLPVWTDKHNN